MRRDAARILVFGAFIWTASLAVAGCGHSVVSNTGDAPKGMKINGVGGPAVDISNGFKNQDARKAKEAAMQGG
jgi:hypothetical protein